MFKKINSIEEGKWLNYNSFLVCLVIVFSFLLVPQLVASILYFGRGVDEIISLIIGNIFLAVLFLIVFFPTLKKQFIDFKNHFSDNFYKLLKIWGIGLAIMLVSNLIINRIILNGVLPNNEEINRGVLNSFPIVGFFEMVFVSPFLEEMIFRFGLRKSWGKNKAFPFISAFIFGLLHTFNGITSVNDLIYLLYIIPYGAVGYSFAYLYNESDNIFMSMCAHMIHNFMTISLIFLFT